jgi:hypothetical protein
VATVTFVIPIATAALCAPVLIAFHRYILLEDVASRYEFDLQGGRFRRYFGYSLFFVLFGAIPTYAPMLIGENLYADVVSVAGFGIFLTVLVWAALIFPAIAVDAPNIGWVAAFRDLRGNFWRAFGIGVAITAPAFAIMPPSLLLDRAFTESFLESRPIGQSEIGLRTVLVWLIWGALYTLMAALWTVAASHLYRMLGNDLRRNGLAADAGIPRP